MSLKAMADSVRAERAAIAARAPARANYERVQAGLRLKEKKRRAWDQARPIFEAAFERQFAPGRPTYRFEKERRTSEVCYVLINYEGKLDAWVEVWPEDRPNYLYVRPVGSDERPTLLQASLAQRDELARRLARCVADWGLA